MIWWCPSALGVLPAALRLLLHGLEAARQPCLLSHKGLLVSLEMFWGEELSSQL